MIAVKCILLIAAGAFLGHYYGKQAIDHLVDANIKEFKKSLGWVLVILVLSVLLAAVDPALRAGWIVGTILLLVGTAFGFLYYPFHNSNYGLKVKWDDSVGTIVPDLVFDPTRPETGYDLYLPAKKREDGTYALALYIHGGGFTGGSKKDGAAWCKYMTAKGFVSASMDYTLQGKGQKSDLHLMARQALECTKAIQAECTAQGYLVTEMTVTGGSAGGAIALLFAYGVGKESPVPIKFVFQQTGPVSFDPVWWGATNYDYDMQAMFISNFSGKEVTPEMIKNGEHHEIVKAMSPASLVDENTVPTLCAYGPRDKMVPARLKYHLFEALERHHVPYDFVEYPNSNHGLYDDPKVHLEFLKKLDEYCQRYFDHHEMSAK